MTTQSKLPDFASAIANATEFPIKLADAHFVCAVDYWLAFGPRIVKDGAVESVRLTDRMPVIGPNGTPSWFMLRDRPTQMPYRLEDCLFSRLQGGRHYLLPPASREYDTPEEANEALSRACIEWAKDGAA